MQEKINVPEIGKCKFNFGVVCTNYNDCENCGWNPSVAASRKDKLKLKLEKKRGKK